MVSASGCSKLTDEGIIALTKSCPRLLKLDLAGCKNITDKSLEALATNCKLIQFLNLANCGISDAGVQKLKESVHLESLKLGWCEHITDNSKQNLLLLMNLISYCSSYQKLSKFEILGLEIVFLYK